MSGWARVALREGNVELFFDLCTYLSMDQERGRMMISIANRGLQARQLVPDTKIWSQRVYSSGSYINLSSPSRYQFNHKRPPSPDPQDATIFELGYILGDRPYHHQAQRYVYPS